jgi:hypothetical protein
MLVCAFLCMFAHETAGAACIRRSLRPLISEGGSKKQNSGGLSREIAKACHDDERATLSLSSPANGSAEWTPDDRLRRATQYSRDISNRAEKPRRTGYPAFAGYDGVSCGSAVRQPRHCEERSDEAIHSFFLPLDGLLRLSSGAHSRDPVARNDGIKISTSPHLPSSSRSASPAPPNTSPAETAAADP